MDRRTTNALVAKARTQHGLLHADTIGQVDPTRTVDELTRSGNWQEVLPGVVAPAALEPTTELLESAAMLWAPDGALALHSAARRSGFWVPDSDLAWLTTPFTSGLRSRAGLDVFRSRRFPEDLASDGFHRWTLPERTLVDLASQLTRKQLEAVLLSAVRKKATTAEAVRLVAETLRKRPSVALVMEVVALWTAERESFLEGVLYDDACAVVPERVERQWKIRRRDGSVEVRFDVAIPELMLAFEADGLLFHSTDEQIAADQDRDRRYFKRGWHTIRFREGVLDNRAKVRQDIREIAARRREDRRAA